MSAIGVEKVFLQMTSHSNTFYLSVWVVTIHIVIFDWLVWSVTDGVDVNVMGLLLRVDDGSVPSKACSCRFEKLLYSGLRTKAR
jgi:hypothetical protein